MSTAMNNGRALLGASRIGKKNDEDSVKILSAKMAYVTSRIPALQAAYEALSAEQATFEKYTEVGTEVLTECRDAVLENLNFSEQKVLHKWFSEQEGVEQNIDSEMIQRKKNDEQRHLVLSLAENFRQMGGSGVNDSDVASFLQEWSRLLDLSFSPKEKQVLLESTVLEMRMEKLVSQMLSTGTISPQELKSLPTEMQTKLQALSKQVEGVEAYTNALQSHEKATTELKMFWELVLSADFHSALALVEKMEGLSSEQRQVCLEKVTHLMETGLPMDVVYKTHPQKDVEIMEKVLGGEIVLPWQVLVEVGQEYSLESASTMLKYIEKTEPIKRAFSSAAKLLAGAPHVLLTLRDEIVHGELSPLQVLSTAYSYSKTLKLSGEKSGNI
ncbi:MAG: hypothetical protein ACNI27_03770 [Desulfovibrio sp.]